MRTVVTCTVIALLVIAARAESQTISLHVGAASSTLSAPPEVEHRRTAVFGTAVSLRVWKALWIRFGATHVGKGGGWDGREGRAEIRAEYVEFSALLKLNVARRVPVHLLLGPSFGFQRACQFTISVQTQEVFQGGSVQCRQLPFPPVRDDWTAVGGIGFTWNEQRPVGMRSFAKHIPMSLEVLYASGVYSIFEDREVGGKTRTLSVVLRAGITLWR